MALPDISQQANYQDGNSVFDSVFILEKLDYDFTKSGPITVSELNVLGISTFNSDVTFGGDISLDEITCRNADVTGIATVSGDLFSKSNLYLTGALVDTSGDTGSSGQILASTGSGTNWIDANTTSVLNATNVGVNLNGTNANQFVSFFGTSSGNNPNRVDAAFTYNPSTNTMSGINYSGTSTFNRLTVSGVSTFTGTMDVEGQLLDGDGSFGSAGQVLTSDGTDLKWDNSSNLPAGSSAKIAITDVTSGTPRLLLSTGSGTQKDVLSNSNLTYNTSSQVITGKISSLSNHDTDDLSEGSTNQYFTTARARASVSATGDLSYNSSNGQFSVNVPSAFVSGMIILWSGNTGNIPTGFVLCDGNNGTPNLTDKFVVGAGAAYSPGAQGGSSSVTLSTSQLPSHNHSFSGSDSHSHTINNHTHSFSANTNNQGAHVHNLLYNHGAFGGSSGAVTPRSGNTPVTPGISGRVSNEGGHAHNISGTTGNPSNRGTNQRNITISGNTGNKGDGDSHENRPPYYALCYIMKT